MLYTLYFIHPSSYFIRHASYPILHTSYFLLHASCFTCFMLHILHTLHTSCLIIYIFYSVQLHFHAGEGSDRSEAGCAVWSVEYRVWSTACEMVHTVNLYLIVHADDGTEHSDDPIDSIDSDVEDSLEGIVGITRAWPAGPRKLEGFHELPTKFETY